MRCYPVGSAVNSCEGMPAADGLARRVRQAAAVGLIAIFAVGCAVSNRIALPPLPQVDVLVLLQASLGPGGAGQAYPVQTISTNLSSAGSAILSACGFVSPPGTAPGNNVVPRGLQITVGTPPGGATNTGCTISGTIDAAVTPGTYVFTVRAADNNAPPQVDDETYSIVVSSLVITLGPNPASTVTGETFAVTWSFTVVGSPANPNQSVLVELVNAANVVEDSCTAAIGAGGCGGLASPAVGNKTIRLTYPAPGQADPNFPAGGGASRAHTVTAASTTTTITADAPDPSVSGQQYTVNLTVAPVAPGAGAPTGSVSVSDGLGNNCVAALTPGANQSTGSCVLNGPTPGGRTLTASYAGDANYSASVGTDAHTVNPAPTTTTITSDVADPSVVGEAYTINVTVDVNAPGAGTPTGVVAINDGQGVSCNATLAAGPGANQASGSCSLTSLTTAANTLAASYPGDTNFAASNDTEGHTVTPAPTTTKISSIVPATSVGFSVSGESYTVSFEVSSTAGVGEPTGTVTVDDGSGQSCSSALTPGAPGSGTSTGGCVLVSASASGPGPAKTITATYPSPPAAGSDPNFIGSSGTAAHTVNPADTMTTNVSSSPLLAGIRTSEFQEAVTFTATVAILAPGSATPVGLTGTVDFVNITAVPATNLCTAVALTGGMATCTVSNLAVGIHSVEARYDAGNTDLNFNSSTGTERQQVVPAATQTAVASSVNPSTFPQAVTFTATVTVPGPGSGSPIAPTGTVTFSDGLVPIGGCVALALSSGQAACTVPNALAPPLTVGAHSITASYSGDTNFAASDNLLTPLAQVVNAAPTITPIVLGDGVEGRAIGAGTGGLAGVRFPITGGTAPYACSDPGGTLPAGISVVLAATGTDCELQGTPSAGASAGSPYSVDITVTDANSATDTTGPMTWDINLPLLITDPATLADAVEDRNYNFAFSTAAIGGNGPYIWSESGGPSLGSGGCTGFALAGNGALTGTAPLAVGGGACNFTAQVTDTATTTTAAGNNTQATTIVVQPMLAITAPTVPNAKRGSTFSPAGPGLAINSVGGTGVTPLWTETSGSFTCNGTTCSGNALVVTIDCTGFSFPQAGASTTLSGSPTPTITAPADSATCSATLQRTDASNGPTAGGSSAGQGISILILNTYAYAAAQTTNTLEVINTDTNALVESISAGGAPDQVAVSRDGHYVFASITGTEQVAIVDASTNLPLTNSPIAIGATCDQPIGLAVALVGTTHRLFVACSGGDATTGERIVGYDFNPASGGSLTPMVTSDLDPAALTRNPQRLALTPDGLKLYGTVDTGTNNNGRFVQINPVTGSIDADVLMSGASQDCEEPRGIAIAQTAAAGNPIEAYIVCPGNDRVRRVDTSNNAVAAVINLPATNAADSVAFTPEANAVRAYVTLNADDTIAVIDTASRAAVAGSPFALPDPAAAANANANPLGITIPNATSTAPGTRVFISLSGLVQVGALNDAVPPTSGTNNPIGVTLTAVPRGIASIPNPR